MSAYAASKAALVRTVETLAVELKPDGVDVNAVAPGAMNTRMMEEALAAGPEKVGSAYYEKVLRQKREGGVPPELGVGNVVIAWPVRRTFWRGGRRTPAARWTTG